MLTSLIKTIAAETTSVEKEIGLRLAPEDLFFHEAPFSFAVYDCVTLLCI